jgi:hypothetical protein
MPTLAISFWNMYLCPAEAQASQAVPSRTQSPQPTPYPSPTPFDDGCTFVIANQFCIVSSHHVTSTSNCLVIANCLFGHFSGSLDGGACFVDSIQSLGITDTYFAGCSTSQLGGAVFARKSRRRIFQCQVRFLSLC